MEWPFHAKEFGATVSTKACVSYDFIIERV